MNFYYLSRYLGAAAAELKTSSLLTGQCQKQWLAAAKEKLKQGKASEVVIDLGRHVANAPETISLSRAHQYRSSPLKYPNYARALARNQPIGSGQVKSRPHSVLQAMLKNEGPGSC